eukprot:gnl/MRDRNA2_/MRDRNA2_19533_c0_seq1.p1 gnl/MRDRNA2_/MRDRNA2_19533_c0~~gnl/MRDRNA2_/MRDRNA2_19533_c0_seq1.p1  ORF type:complete len:241 (+),score=37.89 gnl/MRDRNA2_/MRDRNA2_19533_c0_seq1:42-725(+)
MAPPGAATGPLVDGWQEVKFGQFDASNFRSPFGPQSVALYSEGSAAIGATSLTSSFKTRNMAAVEFALVSDRADRCTEPRQRRRLVAIWQMPKESQASEKATLASITAIIEEEIVEKLPLSSSGEVVTNDYAVDWGTVCTWPCHRTVIHLDGETSNSRMDATSLLGSPMFQLQGGICAWLPSSLPCHADGSIELAIGWHAAKSKFVRIAAIYDHGEFTAAAHDILVE